VNKKGVIFSLDLIIALALFVFILGSIYAFYHYKIVDVVEQRNINGRAELLNTALNTLAYGPNKCDLIANDGTKLKEIAFCWNDSSPAILDFNTTYKIRISCPAESNKNCLNLLSAMQEVPANTEYIAKDIKLLVTNKDVTKKEYLDCLKGVCSISEKEVRIYVWG